MSSDNYATLEEALEHYPNAIAVIKPSENWAYKNNPYEGRYVPLARIYRENDGELIGVPSEITEEAKKDADTFIGYCINPCGYHVVWKAEDFEIRDTDRYNCFDPQEYYYGKD